LVVTMMVIMVVTSYDGWMEIMIVVVAKVKVVAMSARRWRQQRYWLA
jgi:hypothetical protein